MNSRFDRQLAWLPVCAVVLLATAVQARAADAPGPTAAVFELTAERVDPGIARLVTQTLVGELRRSSSFARIISSADLDAMMGFEKQKQLMNCSQDSCMAELAGALGVDYLVVGSVGELGGTYLLNLRLLEPRKAVLAANVNLRVVDQAGLPDLAARAGYDLMKSANMLKPDTEAPTATAPAATPAPAAGSGAANNSNASSTPTPADAPRSGPRLGLVGAGGAALAVGLLAIPVVAVLVVGAALVTVLPYAFFYVPTPGLPYAARSVFFPATSAVMGGVAAVAGLLGLALLAGGVGGLTAGFVL